MSVLSSSDDTKDVAGFERLQPFITKSDRVYQALREAVLNGDLEPGTRVNLAKVSKELGTSETPVREALKRLESERLVRAEPHTGFIVAEIGLEELIENLILRRDIEAIATQLAATMMSPADIVELSRYVENMETAAQGDDWATYARINKQFHLALISRCPLGDIRRTAVALWEVGERTRSLFVRRPRREGSQEEHRAMLRAIESRDFAALGELVRQQKSASIDVALEMLDPKAREHLQSLLGALDEGSHEPVGERGKRP